LLIDLVEIEVKAGDGGDGVVSFLRDKMNAFGGPDGGNGGRGGDVILRSDEHLSTLADYRYSKRLIAASGGNGASLKRTGKSAPNLELRVPAGTVVRDLETGELLADLSGKESYVVAAGGRGGAGNFNFATSKNRAPKYAKPGEVGVRRKISLELKLLADVGLVGFPNVGKSSIISRVSCAKPKVANYPFTTLEPALGVVSHKGQNFVIADIPGLIKGSSSGRGLGFKFLRHIQRCRILVHVVDISSNEGRNPKLEFLAINDEIFKYDPKLKTRPMIVVGNKVDLEDDESAVFFEDFVKCEGYEFLKVSAATGFNLDKFLDMIAEKIAKLAPIEIEGSILHTRSRSEFVELSKKGKFYILHSDWLEKIIKTLNLETYDARKYFKKILDQRGITKRLTAGGVIDGDLVKIGNSVFVFEESHEIY
jgi:GTP-binding protein